MGPLGLNDPVTGFHYSTRPLAGASSASASTSTSSSTSSSTASASSSFTLSSSQSSSWSSSSFLSLSPSQSSCSFVSYQYPHAYWGRFFIIPFYNPSQKLNSWPPPLKISHFCLPPLSWRKHGQFWYQKNVWQDSTPCQDLLIVRLIVLVGWLMTVGMGG